MQIEIKVPSVGESITEAILAQWYKQNGDSVQKDEALFVIETDKVTLEVVAEASGILTRKAAEGDTVAIGAVVGFIDAAKAGAAPAPPEKAAPAPPPAEPEPTPLPAPAAAPQAPAAPEPSPAATPPADAILSPAVRRLVAARQLDPAAIPATGPGGRLTKGDVLLYLETHPPQPGAVPPAPAAPETAAVEGVVRKPMSPIRRRIAQRLLAARQNTAMLTTFNEIDMSRAMAIRSRYKADFKDRHGVNLGFMSFFIKASVDALQLFPAINAFIEGQDILYNTDANIAVAIGSEKGLVVPVIRRAQTMSFAGLEKAIVDYVAKIKDNRLALTDLEGGTFTISNGGVYGSLLSTPILNMPQSGILGMHKIEKRPVVVNDEIVIRPMMYVALSYDHRIVDGREAVTFLKRIKECVEDPERMMMEI